MSVIVVNIHRLREELIPEVKDTFLETHAVMMRKESVQATLIDSKSSSKMLSELAAVRIFRVNFGVCRRSAVHFQVNIRQDIWISWGRQYWGGQGFLLQLLGVVDGQRPTHYSLDQIDFHWHSLLDGQSAAQHHYLNHL